MKKEFKVKGMHCTSCEELLKDSLEEAGVKKAVISYKKGSVVVDFDGKDVSQEQIKGIVVKEGYEVIE